MSRSKSGNDPHAEREAARYDNPIPSREVILELLEEADKPLSNKHIARALKLEDEDDLEALRRRLRAMERDSQVMRNRRGAYGPLDKLHLQRCRVQGHRDGYGFAAPVAGGDDFYLSSREMDFVFDGDEVLVAVAGVDPRGRQEGKIVEVVQRAHTEVVGRFASEGGIGHVVPDNGRINHQILIPPGAEGGAQPGQIVSCRITDYPQRRLGAKGEVIDVLGDHLDPGLEIEVAIRSHNIPHEWPDGVQREAAALAAEPAEADKLHRVDLRQLPFVTIDGADARDFDDAVYCEQTESGGWRLWVAIADVSHYVQPGSALDDEAAIRGNSVYFPERVVPMLPEALSNGLCSLMPQVDRLAMVCEMELGIGGTLLDCVFYEAVIHSHARLTYDQVWAALSGEGDAGPASERMPELTRLHALYKVLRLARDKRGAIDFETVETRIVFNAERKIDAIVPVHRNDAHKLIEECMLCANVATAQFFESVGLPMLYRVHLGPTPEKLENLRSFLGELGLDLRGGEKPTPEHYQRLLSEVADRDDAKIIQTMLLRSLSQAAYRPDNEGHFGLNYLAYAHFTSPIRRYADLLVHRGLRSVIRSDRDSDQVRRCEGAGVIPAKKIFPYDMHTMVAAGAHISMTERRADDATREVEAWLKCEYLQEHVGDSFAGVITAVTSFGMFVELQDLYIEGLVHISALPSDYYRFDHAHQRLLGERSGRSFALGDTVAVQVARVDLDDRKIDLELVEGGDSKKSKKSGKGKSKTKAKGKEKAKGQDKAADDQTATADAADKPAKARGKSRRRRR